MLFHASYINANISSEWLNHILKFRYDFRIIVFMIDTRLYGLL